MPRGHSSPRPHVITLISMSFICWEWAKDGKSIVIMSCPDIQRMATETSKPTFSSLDSQVWKHKQHNDYRRQELDVHRIFVCYCGSFICPLICYLAAQGREARCNLHGWESLPRSFSFMTTPRYVLSRPCDHSGLYQEFLRTYCIFHSHFLNFSISFKPHCPRSGKKKNKPRNKQTNKK